MAQLPIPELVTHAQRVCRFYKRCLRNIASWEPFTTGIRCGDVPHDFYHLENAVHRHVKSIPQKVVFFENNILPEYESVLLRDRFDKNKNIKDLRLAKQLLAEGEQELAKKLHPHQLVYPESPYGGPAYDRDIPLPDWVLDYWHPMEKAAYPKYFALREKRKKEYIEFYKKNYLTPQEKKHPEKKH